MHINAFLLRRDMCSKYLKVKAMFQPNWAHIRELPLFCDLTETTANALLCAARIRRFPKQMNLFREGETANFLHIVVDGMVALFGAHNGEETTIEIAGRGSILFLAAAIRNAVHLNSARTLTPAQTVMIPAQIVRDLCDRDAAVARVIIVKLAEHCHGSVRALKNIKLRPSAERLANWILRTGTTHGKNGHIELPFEKRTLASCLGMSPENLSRNLALLTKHGVRISGHEIVIDNPSALAKFAKPNPLIDD
jgi:CRP/FNR family transcriptional regulator, transcriptional activator FtrB